MVKFVP